MATQELIQLYADTYGTAPAHVEQLPGAGSNRRYYRLSDDDRTVIGCVGTSVEENRAFFRLAQLFAQRRLPVPAVYAMNADATCYLQEDLGNRSLFDFLSQGRQRGGAYSDEEVAMLKSVMTDLPRFQFEAAGEDVWQHCYPLREMDAQSIQFDLNYFKYNYLKLTGTEFNELMLEADFQQFKANLLQTSEQGFMYRDFQARNMMLTPQGVRYIDFQGGRRGPIYYDVASFLWQASAYYSEELRQTLTDTYLDALQPYLRIDRATFMQHLRRFVLFRTLQVLGAYGLRGLWERKPHFIESIPPALANLQQSIEQGSCDRYPYLKEIALNLIASQLQSAPSVPISPSLSVTIWSFSYKHGIPDDASGNGGGYVFDCRSTNNPGRYAEYKQLTGLDRPVIDFLERDGEILTFLESVRRLADFHVRRYIDRGFTHLQFCFGCTGGQHRSVYSAQHLAEYLHRRFGIEVNLIHREQNIRQHFPKRTEA